MPHYDLDATASDIVSARMDADRRLAMDLEKIDRITAKRRARIERERSVNRAKLETTLARVIGVQSIPRGAAIGIKQDGVGVVEWADPTQSPSPSPQVHAPIKKKATETSDETSDELASITPMPVNGAVVGAPN